MEVIIREIPQEVSVYTVSVQKNPVKTKNTYLFSCIFCSWQIAQVQGLVSKIMPGLEPTDNVVIINKCARCKLRYTFQEINYREPEVTRIVLSRWFENVLLCYMCFTPLVGQVQGIMVDLIAKKPFPYPYALKCPKCPANYKLIDEV